MKTKILNFILPLVFVMTAVTGYSQDWSLTGNAGTTPGTNYVGTSDNKKLVFGTSGNARMVIDTTGYVRIGTSTAVAAYPLVIAPVKNAGSISSGSSLGVGLHVNDGAALGQQIADKHAVFASLNTNKDILFTTTDGTDFDEWMRITYQGKVGIGTATPGALLHLYNASSPFIRVQAGGGTASYIQMDDATTYGYMIKNGTSSTANGATAGALYTYVSSGKDLQHIESGTPLFTIKSGGNTGIGTTAPQSRLDVEGNVAIGNTYSGTTAAPTNGAIIEGSVGIGTSSPGAKLDVTIGGSTSSYAIRGTSTSTGGTNYGGYFTATGSSATANIGLFGGVTGGTSNYNLYLGNLAASANNYSVYSPASAKSYFGGDVGIGTTAPGYQLEVSTNSAAKPTSSSWTVSSDNRLKKNVQPFTDGLDVLHQIEPVWFTYNGLGGTPLNETGVGTIAQQLQLICPYMIKPFNRVEIDTLTNSPVNVTYLGVDYGAMDFILINSIKEQQNLIDSLKQKQKVTDSLLYAQKATDSLLSQTINSMIIHQQAADSLLNATINNLMVTVTNCCAIGPEQRTMQINNYQSSALNIELTNSQILLFQNQPNPFDLNTVIRYFVPENTIGSAFIIFYDMYGQEIKKTEITSKGFGNLNVTAEYLSSGIYSYSMILDGKIIDTKKMIKNK